jgi:hypothetical protein
VNKREEFLDSDERVASNKKTPKVGIKVWTEVFVASWEKDTQKE